MNICQSEIIDFSTNSGLVVKQIAESVLMKRFLVTVKDMNAINSKVIEKGINLESAIFNDRHIAEIIAENNLMSANTRLLKKKVLRLKAQIAKAENDRLARSKKGRTPGAGAGGFNRDLESISHRIDIYRADLKFINSEIVRRTTNNFK